ncbi:hypothetical protein C8A00DRAFT_36487 [Chaetomidium leptoderma]|uniref:K Homology domain-containing protein n=1 Tax=Chaetomidium leptoderma TaxID=669021 RepID=A0AAN6VG52_9PEZI|nr:hypothetical protein C8A00DRAFT_36487 [Chaetomidium leptoderma]
MSANTTEISAASQLLRQHTSSTAAAASDAASASASEAPSASAPLDTGVEETTTPSATMPTTTTTTTTTTKTMTGPLDPSLFPELGGTAPAPGPSAAPVWPRGANGTSTGAAPPPPPPTVSLPGQYRETLLVEADHILPQGQLKRPLANIVKEFNRKSRAQIRVVPHAEDMLRIEATGPRGPSTTQVLKDFIALVGAKLTTNFEIPSWVRPHIIGKGGAAIKALQDTTGARIHVPKSSADGGETGGDDDDYMTVVVEGNSQQVAHARNLVLRIWGERAGQANGSAGGAAREDKGGQGGSGGSGSGSGGGKGGERERGGKRDGQGEAKGAKGPKGGEPAEKEAASDDTDTVVRKIDVPRKYHKALIGTGGATLRDIVVKAGGSDTQRELTRTIQFPKQGADGNTIEVKGRSEVVDKIVAQIHAMVAERESQVDGVLDVPVEKHRSIVGRGGDTKRDVEARFNVSIDVPRQGSGHTKVKIVGQSAEDVEKAKAHIQTLVQDQQGETLQIPRALHHAVANNGQLFRRLRNDYNVAVSHDGHKAPPKPTAAATTTTTRAADPAALPLITDDEDAAADAHSWKVVEQTSPAEEGDIPWVLRGSADNLEKAKKAIRTSLDQASKNTTVGYLTLPDPATHRFVIGRAGAKVNVIRKQSGCTITVPRDQARGEAIQVVGTREGVEKARDLILAAVKEGLAAPPPRSSRAERE